MLETNWYYNLPYLQLTIYYKFHPHALCQQNSQWEIMPHNVSLTPHHNNLNYIPTLATSIAKRSPNPCHTSILNDE